MRSTRQHGRRHRRSALDGRVVRVRTPPSGRRARRASSPTSRTSTSTLATPAAKVIINARTGSVVMNQAVTLGACAVAHGNLSVTISTDAGRQPAGAVLAAARPWSAEKADIAITQEARHAGADARRRRSWPTWSRR